MKTSVSMCHLRRLLGVLALTLVCVPLQAWAQHVCADSSGIDLGDATGTDSFACGHEAVATGIYSTAVGDYAGANPGTGNERNTAIGSLAGSNVTGNSNTASGAGAGGFVTGDNNTASGYLAGALVFGDGNIAMGANAGTGDIFTLTPLIVNNTVAIGSYATGSANNAIAIGHGAQAQNVNSVALGSGSVADRDNSVSVGSAGNERQITNVAAGTAPTDAANVGQLQQVAQRLNAFEGVVDQNRRDANGGIAAAMAMSSLPQAIKPGGMMVGVGMASWEGESGAAIGFSRRSQSDSVTVKAVVNFNSRGKAGVGVGVGFEF